MRSALYACGTSEWDGVCAPALIALRCAVCSMTLSHIRTQSIASSQAANLSSLSLTSTPPSLRPARLLRDALSNRVSPRDYLNMGNTVARSHIRDADRGVAKATRANTRRNSSGTAALHHDPPPISISSSVSTLASAAPAAILPNVTSTPDLFSSTTVRSPLATRPSDTPPKNLAFPENRHSFTYGSNPSLSASKPPKPPPRNDDSTHAQQPLIKEPRAATKRRQRHTSADIAFSRSMSSSSPSEKPRAVSLTDPNPRPTKDVSPRTPPRPPRRTARIDPNLPGSSVKDCQTARTQTPPRVDKPPRARKVVSFNENVHVVTYPYDGGSPYSSCNDFPSITRYPEVKGGKRRGRSVFRLLSKVGSAGMANGPDSIMSGPDYLPEDYDACCVFQPGETEVVYDESMQQEYVRDGDDGRLLSFDSSKDTYEEPGLIVSFERARQTFSSSKEFHRPTEEKDTIVDDDFDYTERKDSNDDTLSLSDAHPSCDAIDEPEAICDQLLSPGKEHAAEARVNSSFDIAPLWQRLKRVDELDAVDPCRNTFIGVDAGGKSDARGRRRYFYPKTSTKRTKVRDGNGNAIGISHSRQSRMMGRQRAKSKPAELERGIFPLSDSFVEPASAPLPKVRSLRGRPPGLRTEPNVAEEFPVANLLRIPEEIPMSPTHDDEDGSEEAIEQDDTELVDAPQQPLLKKDASSQTMPEGVDADRELVIDAVAAMSSAVSGDIVPENDTIPETQESAPRNSAPLVAEESHEILQPDLEATNTEQKSSCQTSDREKGSTTPPEEFSVPAHDEENDAEPSAISAEQFLSEREDRPLRLFEEDGVTSHSWTALNDIPREVDIRCASLSNINRVADSTETVGEALAIGRITRPELEPLSFCDEDERESERGSLAELGLDPLAIAPNDDYALAPCSPVAHSPPVAGVYYGNSSPSIVEPISPEADDTAEYPEYAVLKGAGDAAFGSEPDTPILGGRRWDDAEGLYDLDEGKAHEGHDRGSGRAVPEVLLHDWSGNIPVEPSVEMVDSAPNSSNNSAVYAVGQLASTGMILTTRLTADMARMYGGSDDEVMAIDPAKEFTRTTRVREGLNEDVVVHAPQAWIPDNYESSTSASRKKPPREKARARTGSTERFVPGLPNGLKRDSKLEDFQLTVERKSFSEMGYGRPPPLGRGTSFVDTEDSQSRGERRIVGDEREIRMRVVNEAIVGAELGVQMHVRRGWMRRRRLSNVETSSAGSVDGGGIRGAFGRLVSGVGTSIARRLASQG